MVDKKYKRRNYLIKKGFQLRYTLSILFVLIVVMLVSGTGLYLGMWASIIKNFSEFKVSQDLETAKRIAGYEDARYGKGDYRLERIFREAELLSERQRKALNNALQAVNKSLLPKMVLLFILIFIGGIFVSHKMAGPMYRFEHSAEAIKKGDLKARFKIRKGDEMRKTASFLEGMTESLRVDIEKIKIAKDKLEDKLSDITKNLSEEDRRHLAEIVKEIDNALSKYKT